MTHHTNGRRYSYISDTWILESSWNDVEEIASLRNSISLLKHELSRKDGALRTVGALKQLGGMLPGTKQIVDSVVEACAAALKPTKEG